ncbi:hypothetical protein TNCT_67931 [Trichonephila clavata]|uniref:Uncharacterized protein n=1 Tax=Trichonephila clavata TaxID=2740835 RepID=A0A8X6KXU5_TRICU|nr:hypothetical protein TNCT_67931 [Trichonephila clavata]
MGFPTKRSRDFLLCSEKFWKSGKLSPFPNALQVSTMDRKLLFRRAPRRCRKTTDCEFSPLPTTLHPSSIRQLSCWNFYATYRPAPRSIPA